MVESLVRQAGGDPTVLPIVPDDEDATREAIRGLDATVDIAVTIGGVSVGDYDFVREVLDEETGGMSFWKVRMKPGKPLAFGMLAAGTPVIGLPGNPVSSFVGFHQFVRPALAVLQGAGAEDALLTRIRARAATDIRSTPRRRQYLLGNLLTTGEELCFEPHPSQSSGNVLSTCGADAFGLVDEGVDHIDAGEWMDVEIL
jgi:molybdopterin molybdotransferase